MSEALLELLRPLGGGNAGNKGNVRNGTRKHKDPQNGGLLHARNTTGKPGVTGPSSVEPGKPGPRNAVTRVTPVTFALGHLHVEFEERAAVFEYEGRLSRFEAEQSAADALGYADPESVFAAVAQHWLARIEEAEKSGHANSLVNDALRFARIWGSAAAALTLDEAGLFGVVPLPAEGYRLANTGLVPLLKGGRVTALTREVATVLAVDGTSQGFALWNLNYAGQAVPFWELHPDDVISIGGYK